MNATLRKKDLRQTIQTWMIVVLLVASVGFFGLTQKSYLTFNNMHAVFYNASIDALACIGFTLLLIMGEIDMSVGSMACLGGALMSYFILAFKMPLWLSIVIVFAVGAVLGYLMGLLVTSFRLNAMMVTIGAMMALRSIAWVFVNMFNGRQLPSFARQFACAKLFGKVYVVILVVIALVLVSDFLLRRSKILRQMYYVGHNEDTCTLYGIHAARVKRLAFAFSGAMAAVCGAFKTARFSHAATDTGYNLEIMIITAAVLGGASIFGGKGSVGRTYLGLVFIYALQAGLTAFAVNSYVQQIMIGVILILAIILDIVLNRKTRKG